MKNRLIFFYPFLILVMMLCSITQTTLAQKKSTKKIRIKGAKEVVLPDTVIITTKDTVLYLTEKEVKEMKVGKSPYAESSEFYDTLEKKISNTLAGDIFQWVTTNERGKEKQVNIMQNSESFFFALCRIHDRYHYV